MYSYGNLVIFLLTTQNVARRFIDSDFFMHNVPSLFLMIYEVKMLVSTKLFIRSPE